MVRGVVLKVWIDSFVMEVVIDVFICVVSGRRGLCLEFSFFIRGGS